MHGVGLVRSAVNARYHRVMECIQPLVDAIQPMPAYTLQGIAVKARVAHYFAVRDMGDEHNRDGRLGEDRRG
jgi:hypothetical protein